MGGIEGAGGAAQDEGKHPGPWLWQGGQWGAAAAEGGRRVNRLEVTLGVGHSDGHVLSREVHLVRVRVRVRASGEVHLVRVRVRVTVQARVRASGEVHHEERHD